MDHKVTLSFNEEIFQQSKKFAAENNISLSRLIELLLKKAVSPQYRSLEDMPVSSWMSELSEGSVEYKQIRSRKSTKDEFHKSKK